MSAGGCGTPCRWLGGRSAKGAAWEISRRGSQAASKPASDKGGVLSPAGIAGAEQTQRKESKERREKVKKRKEKKKKRKVTYLIN